MTDTPRTALLVAIGRTGIATVHFAERVECGARIAARLETWAESDSVAEALAAGCPLIDLRPCALADVIDYAFKGPMFNACHPDGFRLIHPDVTDGGLDGCGFGSLDYAPVHVLAALAAARGAVVRNVEAGR